MLQVDITLRPAVQGHSDFLFARHRAGLGPVVAATCGSWDDAAQRAFHDAWFADPSRVAIVLVDGETADVIDAQEQLDGVLYLARIERLRSVQGRGVGTQLLRQRIEHARRAGLRAVELEVLIVSARLGPRHRARRSG